MTAPLLRRRPGDVHLFAGAGPPGRAGGGRRLEDLAGRVLVLGSRGDVGDLLAASDSMLFASRTEGMPASLIEAGHRRRRPTALTGVPEVETGVTGLLVQPRRPRRPAAAARWRGCWRTGAAAGLGAAAQARCRDGIAGIAAAYRKVYEEVAAACPVS